MRGAASVSKHNLEIGCVRKCIDRIGPNDWRAPASASGDAAEEVNGKRRACQEKKQHETKVSPIPVENEAVRSYDNVTTHLQGSEARATHLVVHNTGLCEHKE